MGGKGERKERLEPVLVLVGFERTLGGDAEWGCGGWLGNCRGCMRRDRRRKGIWGFISKYK